MDGGGQAQARPPNQQLQNLIRPEQVQRLPHLSPQQKEQTRIRVEKYWEFIHQNQHNQTDQRYLQASRELATLSGQLMQGMKNFNLQRQQRQREQAMQGGQPQTQPAQPPAQPQPQAQANTASQPNQSSSAITFSSLLPEVQQRVNQQTFYYPPAMTEGTRPAEQWLQEAKARFGQAIQRAQMAKQKKAELQRAAQSRQQSGNPLNQDEQNGLNAKLAQCEKAIRESQSFMEKFKEQQETFRGAPRSQQRFAQSNGSGQAVTGGESGSSEGAATQQMQQNVQGPQAHSIATAQAAARANAANASAGGATPGTSQPMSAGPQQTPMDQAAPGGFGNQNTMMSQAPQSRPTTSAGPGSQSAIHPNAGATTPASHAHPNAVNAHPLNAVNGMKAHPPPIPKNLSVPEPSPVQMPPSRPTLNGGANVPPAALAQPALTTFPGYVLETSEDGHLLSKKKLKDLVREVIGPNSEETLSPEAEEVWNMLHCVDGQTNCVRRSAST